MSKDITLGIFGSGQLGTELVKSAKKLGLITIVFSDDKDGPAQKFSDSYIFSDYKDVSNLEKFINSIDVMIIVGVNTGQLGDGLAVLLFEAPPTK